MIQIIASQCDTNNIHNMLLSAAYQYLLEHTQSI